MLKSKTRRPARFTHTSLDEIRRLRSVTGAGRIVEKYQKVQVSILIEVAYIVAEIANCFDAIKFSEFKDLCLHSYSSLFGNADRFDVFLEVGRGVLPEDAIYCTYIEGGAATYVKMILQKHKQGQIKPEQVTLAISKAVRECSSQPLYDALGYKPKRLPVQNRPTSLPKLIDIEIDKKGRVLVVTTSGMRLLVPSKQFIDKLALAWEEKGAKRKRRS